jgi:hypothetical protein
MDLQISFLNLALFQISEAVSKPFPIKSGFKIKEDDNLSHRNTLKFRGLKFESGAEIGQKGTF